jgi:hypothetical protein
MATVLYPVLHARYTLGPDVEAGLSYLVAAPPSSLQSPSMSLQALVSSLNKDRIPEINANIEKLQEFVQWFVISKDPATEKFMFVP